MDGGAPQRGAELHETKNQGKKVEEASRVVGTTRAGTDP
jgi:hypothetical protein